MGHAFARWGTKPSFVTRLPTRRPRATLQESGSSTWKVVRERATGIEPAFSAWEALQEALRDLRISGKVQVNESFSKPLVCAVGPCLSWRVARNGSDSVCCTLLHGTRGKSQPYKPRTQNLGSKCSFGRWDSSAFTETVRSLCSRDVEIAAAFGSNPSRSNWIGRLR